MIGFLSGEMKKKDMGKIEQFLWTVDYEVITVDEVIIILNVKVSLFKKRGKGSQSDGDDASSCHPHRRSLHEQPQEEVECS